MRKATAIGIAAALSGAFGLAATLAPATAFADPVKCYGIAKAGQNDCASQGAMHSCAGQSKMSYSGKDFKAVDKATCTSMGGKLQPWDGFNEMLKKKMQSS